MESVKIGKRIKAHGLQGEIRMEINSDALPVLMEKAYLLLAKADGAMVPYFISDIRGTTDAVIVKLENVDTIESAKALTKGDVFLRAKDLPDEFLQALNKSADSFNWEGYQLENVSDGSMYPISGMEAFPMQQMLVVWCDEQEVLVPYVTQWLVERDDIRKIIRMQLPEGLL